MQALLTPSSAAHWLHAKVSGTLCTDSRRLRAGDGFLAWAGERFDARSQVQQALAQGVSACLVEQSGVDAFGLSDERVATYSGLKADSGQIASAYFQEPSSRLAMLAVTGTNGKTSTAWWLAQALSSLPGDAALPCAVVGTLGLGMLPNLRGNGLTTPDPVDLQAALAEFVQQGVRACAIEASSVGIEEHRLDGTRVHTAVFTNLTQDHLDYHGSMASYARAKKKLFDWPGLRAAVINVDDAFGAELAQELKQRDPVSLDLWTVSMRSSTANQARLQAQHITFTEQGLSFTVQEGVQQAAVSTALIGQYNVANLLGVIATLRSLGVSLSNAAAACHALSPVPGRMQCVRVAGKPLVAVDYAHTPDALAQALEALRPMATQRGGQLWCVFGCGGDRDSAKRPIMGAVAVRHADRVVLTSDNPRSESPEAIISQILLGTSGAPGVVVQADRALAIEQALGMAGAADVVLLAGKGHETYQDIGARRIAFSDLAHVQLALGQPYSGHAGQAAL